MNEQLKQLRNTAWKEAYSVDLSDPRIARAHDFMEEGMAKFAELLIKECATALKDGYPPDDLIPVDEVIYCLNTHFGVE